MIHAVPQSVHQRTLPSVLEAEASVVGMILLRPAAFDEVTAVVNLDDFFHPVYRAIYGAMCNLSTASKPIALLTVAEQMKIDDTYGRLRAHGGERVFGELTSAVVTTENVDYFARMIASKALRRRIIVASSAVVAGGYNPEIDDADHVESAEQMLLGVLIQRQFGGSYVHVREGMRALAEAVEARKNAPGGVMGVPSGYPDVDAVLTGYKRKSLNIIAGRPSMGKTAYACCVAEYAAVERGIPVLFFSLEMGGVDLKTGGELVERLVQVRARVDSQKLRNGNLDQSEWRRLTHASIEIANAPLWIDDAPAQTITQLRSKARQWRAREAPTGDAMIVVDYLQLARAPTANKNANREREVADITQGLKALAKETDTAVLALSQLNRGVESRSDKRPNLADLRESGEIEQTADTVTFMYRDEVYNPNTDERGIAEANISKQRNGPLGLIRLKWFGEYARFDSLSPRAG